MTLSNTISIFKGLLFCSCCLIFQQNVNAQFLTPEQLHVQQEVVYDSRTHYEYTGVKTDLFRRANPDYLLRGFFPFWSIVLICFALVFLFISLIGVIGYFCFGCRRPKPEVYRDFEKMPQQEDDQYLLENGSYYQKTANGGDTSDVDDEQQQQRLQESLDQAKIGFRSEDMV